MGSLQISLLIEYNHLEKEDAILYGSIPLTKNSLFMETKSSIVEEIKNTLDEYFLPKE